jgi:hypothetical protein
MYGEIRLGGRKRSCLDAWRSRPCSRLNGCGRRDYRGRISLRSNRRARYGRVDLLCLDELGYMELDLRCAELLF